MHKTLSRQLRKLKLGKESTPDKAGWSALLDAVENAYKGYDEDSYRLDRTLSVYSEEMKSTLKELETSSKRLAAVFENASEGIITFDESGLIDIINPQARVILQLESTQTQLSSFGSFKSLLSEEDYEKGKSILARYSKKDFSTETIDMMMYLGNDQRVEIEGGVSAIRNSLNECTGSVFIFRDVTKTRALNRKIEFQAKHDALTLLMNRTEFSRKVNLCLEEAYNEESAHVLLYMDLDQFKIVNDTCGHIAGDELLRQVASLMQSKIRNHDKLARLGGDEFGLLLPDCTAESGVIVANKVRDAVHSYKFTWDNNVFTIGVSIGLVEINKYSPSSATLFSQVDAACYIAKESGRNQVRVYDASSGKMKLWQGEVNWVAKIQTAIELEKFELYYQSIQPINNTSKVYFEVLLRMIGDDDEIIPPGSFLPAAERYNLTPQIDRYVVEKTFQWIQENRRAIDDNFLCSINLSGLTLSDAGFVNLVTSLVTLYGISLKNICFEITETSAITNLSKASKFISYFKKQGCVFALDDFGSGVSSYAYLKNLPVDIIKIDGSFVQNLDTDEIDCAMVESIDKIGKAMNKKTVAEFVENEAVVEKLKVIGVDYAQGYHFDKPKPLSEFEFIKVSEASVVPFAKNIRKK